MLWTPWAKGVQACNQSVICRGTPYLPACGCGSSLGLAGYKGSHQGILELHERKSWFGVTYHRRAWTFGAGSMATTTMRVACAAANAFALAKPKATVTRDPDSSKATPVLLTCHSCLQRRGLSAVPQRLLCSSFLVLTDFLVRAVRDYRIYYPKRNYIGVSRLCKLSRLAAYIAHDRHC